MEVYVCRMQITNSLMRSLIVPVMNEPLMSRKHLGFADVRLMEGFDLTDRGRPPHTRDNMLNPVSTAELPELRGASSGWIELGSPVGQDLSGFAILFDAFFEKIDRMLRCGVVVDSGNGRTLRTVLLFAWKPFA